MRRSPPHLLAAALCAATLHHAAGAAEAPAAANDVPAVASFFQTSQVSLAALSPEGGYVAAVTMLPDGTQALVIRDTADLKPVSYTHLTLPTTPYV